LGAADTRIRLEEDIMAPNSLGEDREVAYRRLIELGIALSGLRHQAAGAQG
jgi:hypothetical protein